MHAMRYVDTLYIRIRRVYTDCLSSVFVCFEDSFHLCIPRKNEHMKNALLLLLLIGITVVSCKKKDDPIPPEPEWEDLQGPLPIHTIDMYTYVIDGDGDLWIRGGIFSDAEAANERGYFLFEQNVRKFSYGNLSRRMYLLRTDGSVWRTEDRPVEETLASIQEKATEKIADNVQDVQAGRDFAALLKEDGTVWAIGENGSGEFGLGTSTYDELPLTQIAEGVSKIAVSYSNIYLLKTDGTLWAAGNHIYGKLGFPTDQDQKTFVKIMDEVKEVQAVGNQVMLIKKDQTAWSFGSNTNGTQATGSASQDPNYPHQVGSDVEQVIPSDFTAFFIKTDGSLWACGNNMFGIMGMETPQISYQFIPIAQDVTGMSLMSLNSHVVIAQKGEYKMSGLNDNKQLQQSEQGAFRTFIDFEMPE